MLHTGLILFSILILRNIFQGYKLKSQRAIDDRKKRLKDLEAARLRRAVNLQLAQKHSAEKILAKKAGSN